MLQRIQGDQMDLKNNTYICAEETHFRSKGTQRWKWKSGKRYSMQMQMQM